VFIHVVPPSVEYCNVEPSGQGAPAGAVMMPVVNVQETGKQVLLTTLTFSGATDKSGQEDWVLAFFENSNIKKNINT